MKRYNFYVFCVLLWSNAMLFTGHDSSLNEYNVKIIDRNDITRYWLIKQMWKKHNKGIADNKINPLLVDVKKPTRMLQEEFSKTKIIASKLIGKEWVYFNFYKEQEKNAFSFEDCLLQRPWAYVYFNGRLILHDPTPYHSSKDNKKSFLFD